MARCAAGLAQHPCCPAMNCYLVVSPDSAGVDSSAAVPLRSNVENDMLFRDRVSQPIRPPIEVFKPGFIQLLLCCCPFRPECHYGIAILHHEITWLNIDAD